MAEPVLIEDPKENLEKESRESGFLKFLREHKKLSRMELSKLTKLSIYQVEGLEGKGTQSLLGKIFLYIKALGYKIEDVLHLMHASYLENRGEFPRGNFATTLAETSFPGDVKLFTYFQEEGVYLGLLQMPVGKFFERKFCPQGDVLLGIVREGVLVIDTLTKQTVHKKDHFFILPGALPVKFYNGDSFVRVSVLLYSVTHHSKSRSVFLPDQV